MNVQLITLERIRAARDKAAELAVLNPILMPVFDSMDRDYEAAKAGRAPISKAEAIAARRRRTRELI